MNKPLIYKAKDIVICEIHDRKVRYYNQQQTIGYCYMCFSEQALNMDELIEFHQSEIQQQNHLEILEQDQSQEINQQLFKSKKSNKILLIILTILLMSFGFILLFIKHNNQKIIQKKLINQENDQQEIKQNLQQSEIELQEIKEKYTKLQDQYQNILDYLPEYKKLDTKMSIQEYIYLCSLFPNQALNMTQVFKASKDGFTGEEFHNKTKNYKNLIVVVKSDTEQVFGGYTNLGFYSDQDNTYIKGEGKSFIFQLDKQTKFKCLNKNQEIYYQTNDKGFRFGSSDLIIYPNSDQIAVAQSYLGRDYESQDKSFYNGQRNPYLAGIDIFKLIDYEVYLLQE